MLNVQVVSMTQTPGKIVVIGAGIAGLCTPVYARRCGYQVEIVEQHDTAGGLATSWRRGEYTFETCLHWLVGSSPNGTMHAQWQEVFDIDKLTFVYLEEFVRLEDEQGDSLIIYSNVDRLEAELLKRAPQDSVEIKRLTSAIRRFAKFPMPDPSEPWPRTALALLRVLPDLPLLRKWSRLSIQEYGDCFTHKLLRSFFGNGEMGRLSMLALIFSLAWMSERNAGYAVGGSQAIIRLIQARLDQLGARLRLGAKVEKILVEHDAAVGVQLTGGEAIAADWVISAADGRATIYDMLGGNYADPSTEKPYSTMETFPLLCAGLHRCGPGPLRASWICDARTRHAAHARPRHAASAGRVPLLSFRSDLRAARKDRRHLFPADPQFRILG